jgi:anti-sigma regulatory factor (Ser/Thr protein kinase)
VSALCAAMRFPEEDVARAALLTTELTTNLLKHAGHGELLVRALPDDGLAIELMTLDDGPGFQLDDAVRDGYSTTGTLGGGLGAMRRLAREFELYSQPGHGSVLRLVLVAGKPAEGQAALPAPTFQWGAVTLPHPGETVCGDAWRVNAQGDVVSLTLADGLGHGEDAHRAAALATAVVVKPLDMPDEVVQRAHTALRGTRGAALAVARIDLSRAVLAFAGVGNISGVLIEGDSARQMVSHAGIVGHNMRRVQVFEQAFSPVALLVMHSDGLATHWRIDQHPGLRDQHPAIIAAVLCRAHTRGRDDVTVVVLRLRPTATGAW